jgi:uncharacterized membrane protein YbhN (UPF0104 family)
MVAGYIVAAACLVWVFHDVEVKPMLEGMRQVRWAWMALAVAVDILSYVTQALRWTLLLRPVGDVRWLDAAQAIYAGLFASEVLPMRPGEVLRALIVSRRLQANISGVFPSILVERLFDGIWLALGIAVAAMLMPLPGALLRAGDVLGVLIVAATALFLYEVFRQPPSGPEAPRPSRGRLARFRHGFQQIGRRPETWLAFALSLALLMAQMLAFWLVMRGYGLDVNIWTGATVLMIVHLGTAVPNAPANVGTYQFFCVLALTLFGVEKTAATGFSVVAFVILTIPLWLIGFVALGRSGATLAGVRRLEHDD